jgi:hypothetical protein
MEITIVGKFHCWDLYINISNIVGAYKSIDIIVGIDESQL